MNCTSGEPDALHVLGVSHEQLSTGSRSVIAIAPEHARVVAQSLHTQGVSSMVLATCHRLEVYWWGRASHAPMVYATVHELAGVPPHLLCVARDGDDALRHLIAVCGGLRSLRRGEPEILGQVRNAWQLAREDRTSCAALDQIAQGVIAAARHLRRRFEARPPHSIGEATVAHISRGGVLARATVERLRVLMVGAGTVGRSVAHALRALERDSAMPIDLLISNRTDVRADALAGEVNGTSIPWSAWRASIAQSDVVVFSARAPTPLVSRDDMNAMTSTRVARAVWVDLASPANVEAGAASAHVAYYALADITDDDEQRTLVDRLAAHALEREVLRFRESLARRERWMRTLHDASRTPPLTLSMRVSA